MKNSPIQWANNGNLFLQIAADLTCAYATSIGGYQPKAQAFVAVKQDVLLLEHWQQHLGQSPCYGLGLYLVQRLWLALLPASGNIASPNPNPKPVALLKAIQLASMSLFDTDSSDDMAKNQLFFIKTCTANVCLGI